MRKISILGLTLLLASVFSVSCSRFAGHNDQAIVTGIKAQMYSDPSLKTSTIDVASKDGVVTLTGQAADEAAHLAAYKIANETKGVTKVDDQISVLSASTPAPPAEAAPAPEPAPAPVAKPRRTPTKVPAPNRAAPAPSPEPVAASSAVPAPESKPAPPPPPQPVTVTVPANSILTVRTIDSIDSSTNTTGQVFHASLDAPVTVDDRVVVPTGADAYLKLVNAKSAGRLAGRSEVTLELVNLVFQGKTYNIVSSDVQQTGSSRGKRTAATIGGGAALGALIGGIAGGGKGAAIGAAVGGGAGTGVQVLTKGQQVKIPSETRLDFTLQQPLDITYYPNRTTRRHSNSGASSAPDASQDQPPRP